MQTTDGQDYQSVAEPDVSVVLVTYNSAYAIEPALRSVAALIPNAPVIIVDNGSTDRTVEIVSLRGVDQIVSGHGNVGFGRGVNLGIAACSTPLALVINPDLLLTSVDLAELAAAASRRPLGLLGCSITTREGVGEPVMAAWNWRRELLWSLTTFYIKPRRLTLQRPAPRGGRPGWVTGAAFIVAVDEFERVGGFDPELFLYYEDFDLARRYRAHGLRVAPTTTVRGAHLRQEEERGVEVDRVASWVLRSLVQMTASWDGIKAGRRAAALTFRILGLVEAGARAAGRLPGMGALGARKAASARRVMELIVLDSMNEQPPSHYRLANEIFRGMAQHTTTS